MATAKLFAATGDFKNDIQLPAMFDQEVNKVCMYLHIKAILNNNRQGTAQAKNKSSVSGGVPRLRTSPPLAVVVRSLGSRRARVVHVPVRTPPQCGFAVPRLTVRSLMTTLKR